jgi:hypothetical protein
MTVTWNNSIGPEIALAANRGLAEWIGIVERRAVQLITDPPKSGKIYRRRGVEHQASAAGEAPANWTGRLLNSRRIELLPEQFRARLIFSTEYAAPLELGTRKMEPRPYARRALAETEAEGLAAFEGALREALR